LLLWNQFGLPNYWENRYFSKKAVCQLDARKKNVRPFPLKLNQFSSTFFVLGVGSGVSFLVFILEIIYSVLQKNHTRTTLLSKPPNVKVSKQINVSDENSIK
jgi:hypothetical protein